MEVPLKNSHWLCRSHRVLGGEDLLMLIQLYQPLIGSNATTLYLTLNYQLPLYRAGRSALYRRSLLLKICAMSEEELRRSRDCLEGVGLLSTKEFVANDGVLCHEYELIPPLSAVQFFQSEILCVHVYKLLGATHFGFLKKTFLHDEKNDLDSLRGLQVKNITKSFQEVFGALCVDTLKNSPHIVEPVKIDIKYNQGKSPDALECDFSIVKMRLGDSIAEEAWDEALIKNLNEVRLLYRLSEEQLIKYLQNPAVTQQGQVNLRRLSAHAKNEFRRKAIVTPAEPDEMINPVLEVSSEEKHILQLNTIAPLQLLQHYHKGAIVAEADVDLVQSLTTNFELEQGVINVLLEYVLLKYDYQLPRSLVEKIAGHWKRLGITTVKDAMAQAKKADKRPYRVANTSNRGSRQIWSKRGDKLPRAVKEQPLQTLFDETTETAHSLESVEAAQTRIKDKLVTMRERQHQKKQSKRILS